MSNKRALTALYLFMILFMGALHIHRIFALGKSDPVTPIVLRLIVACAIVVALGTKRFLMATKESATVQLGVFMMNFLADQSFFSLLIGR